MNVLPIIQQFAPHSIPANLGKELGRGADGQTFELSDNVIKFSILYSWMDEDVSVVYSKIKSTIEFIKNNKENIIVSVIDHKFIGKFSNQIFMNGNFKCVNQEFIIYSTTMEKLSPLSSDEGKVFHSLLSHEDMNKNKQYSLEKIKEILFGLSKGLDFDFSQVIMFYEQLQKSTINHNDIAPRNIMKDSNNNFKLIDIDRSTIK